MFLEYLEETRFQADAILLAHKNNIYLNKIYKKKGKLYQLKYKNKRIRCYGSEDFVEHENQELIEFIREDLYRCGELNFRKNQKVISLLILLLHSLNS